MSQTESTEDELLALIQADPEEAFRNNTDTLREMRRETDDERIVKLIDYVFEKYDLTEAGE